MARSGIKTCRNKLPFAPENFSPTKNDQQNPWNYDYHCGRKYEELKNRVELILSQNQAQEEFKSVNIPVPECTTENVRR